MNRRIKRGRKIPIHITLSSGLLDEIDLRVSHKNSRSAMDRDWETTRRPQ